jgi:hypothetical protein
VFTEEVEVRTDEAFEVAVSIFLALDGIRAVMMEACKRSEEDLKGEDEGVHLIEWLSCKDSVRFSLHR